MSRSITTIILALAAAVGGVAALPARVDAGANAAELTCAAKDTGETLSGIIPRDILELELTFDDGKGHTHAWKDADALSMSDAVRDHVLLMHVTGEPSLTFWALPKTMTVKSKRGEEHARFDATLIVGASGASDPPPTLRLACTYDYAI